MSLWKTFRYSGNAPRSTIALFAVGMAEELAQYLPNKDVAEAYHLLGKVGLAMESRLLAGKVVSLPRVGIIYSEPHDWNDFRKCYRSSRPELDRATVAKKKVSIKVNIECVQAVQRNSPHKGTLKEQIIAEKLDFKPRYEAMLRRAKKQNLDNPKCFSPLMMAGIPSKRDAERNRARQLLVLARRKDAKDAEQRNS